MTNSLPARARALVLPDVLQTFLYGMALALVFVTVYPISANAGPDGGGPTGVVAQEIARRQKLVDDAKLAIIEGDELVDKRDFGAAVDKYFAAYSMSDNSASAKLVHDLSRNRFASLSVIYARELAGGARYAEAHAALDRVLSPRVAPDNKAAKTLKQQLDDPERFNPALTPEHIKAVGKVERLFQVAEGHMQLGNFDMANLTYASILREDRTNEAARRGMAAADLRISDYHDTAQDHFRAKALGDVDEQWELQVPLSQRAFETAVALKGSSNSSAITDRMRNIIIPRVDFTDETLGSVIEYLTRVSKELDPTDTGVNFLLQLVQEDASLRDLSVNLTLNNVPLGEVVRFVTEQTRTKFRIEQFAVVITSLNSTSTQLITKEFRVPPDFLRNAPAGDSGPVDDGPFGGGGGSNAPVITVRLDAKTFLERNGIPFPAGSQASHIASTNTLFVRNTQTNIDQVDAIIDSLMSGNQNSIRVSITQYVLSMATNDAMSFDHLLGMFNLPGSKSVFGSGAGGSPDATNFAFAPPGSDVPTGQNSLTRGIRTGESAVRSNVINDVTSGDPVTAPGIGVTQSPFAISSPFGDPQYQMAIRALSQQKATTITNQATTVTRPGQRAVIEGVRNFIYPTEYDPPEIPQTFNQNNGGGGGGIVIDPVNQIITLIPGVQGAQNNSFPVTPAHPTAFDVRNVGTRFEVEPTLDPNGYTVTLNMSLEFAQFEGFINYGTPITTSDGVVLTDNRILQPLFRVSRLAQPVHVNDGANFVIGGIIEDDVQFTNDKVPVLGDIPLVGRFFKGKVAERRKKAVLFFVRVQIIAPDGSVVNQPVGNDDF
ncbi:MAG: general secretion pathway protein D [Verrucomicrobiales bacterium]|jgi:general secretion pathway protein D